MRKTMITALILAGILAAGAAGCAGNAAGSAAAGSQGSPVAAVEQKQETSTNEKNKEETMSMRIKIGGRTLHATLYNNDAAKKLWASLPVSYPMMNLYDREMCYRMGRGALPTKEAKDTGYKVGDISYWPPMGSLVILYNQNGEVFEQQPIGHTDDDLSFLNGLADTSVTFERDE